MQLLGMYYSALARGGTRWALQTSGLQSGVLIPSGVRDITWYVKLKKKIVVNAE
jgi:hypothetical protein